MTFLLIIITGIGLLWLIVAFVHGLICYSRWRWKKRQQRLQNTPLSLQVIQRYDFNDQRFMVRLAALDNTSLPRFNPGQFLTVCVSMANSSLLSKRRYSISNWQDQPEYYELCIKRVTDGKVSNLLFDTLQTGSEISVLTPSGKAFPLLHDLVEIILIAGGVGISPVRSILHYHLQQSHAARISLFYSAAEEHDLCYFEELSQFSRQQDRFYFYPSLTRGNSEWEGRIGRITISNIMDVVSGPQQAVFILCGPELMQESLISDLQEQGIKPSQIYFEHFGLGKTIVPEQVFRIQLQSGKQFHYDSQPTLLAALEENEVSIASSCRSGECGDCRIRLLEGKVSELHQSSIDLKDNEILSCSCVPESDLILAI